MVFNPFNKLEKKLLKSIEDQNYNPNVILELIDRDIAWLNKPLGKTGESLIHRLVKAQNLDALQQIIDHLAGKQLTPKQRYAIFNVKNKYGSTPLHYVAENKNEAILDLLLIAGADMHVTDSSKKAPFEIAFCNGFKRGAQKLFSTQLFLNDFIQQFIIAGKVESLQDFLVSYPPASRWLNLTFHSK